MKKLIISKLFLYRHRFAIGFIVLGAAYIGILFGLPLLAPNGLSELEMESAAESYALDFDSFFRGDIVNLPYRLLQKLSIMTFGLSIYSVKLPSIIIGTLLGCLLILLLNRWFKSNVALLASILAVLSASFLYLAGSGTPLIMLVFWPTLLLWLGSKIQGVTKPKPLYCFVFAFALLASALHYQKSAYHTTSAHGFYHYHWGRRTHNGSFHQSANHCRDSFGAKSLA